MLASHTKILSHHDLFAQRERLRAEGLSLVHCHGCFDIVHPGHIRHLRHARSLGDRLLVSITGDSLIRKGDGRPLIPQELRAENLAALDCVDFVHIDASPTAEVLLSAVQPDIYVKGKEYEHNGDPRFARERAAVEAGGGRVVFSSGDVVFSSTALIAALEQSADPFHLRLTELCAREELAEPALAGLLARFTGKRVVIVGETILDTYLLCDRPGVAGEAPVLTLRPLEARQYDGGAAIIARHMAAFGASPILVTALPRSTQAGEIERRLSSEGVEVRCLRIDKPVPEKQRFLVGQQKVLKLDLVEPLVLDLAQQRELAGLARDAAQESGDAGVLADFGLGLLSRRQVADLCGAMRPHVGVLSGDVSGRRSSLLGMRDLDLACPSEGELRDATQQHDEGLSAAAWELMDRTRTKASLVTLGADGLIAFSRLPTDPMPMDVLDGPPQAYATRLRGEHIPALTPVAIDPLGCGDALLATATLALASGGSLLAGAFLGSCAASVQVQRLGNTTISQSDIRKAMSRAHGARLAFDPSRGEGEPRRAIAL